MRWGKCRRCGEYTVNPHLCLCRRFLCWYDGTQNNPDEGREIYAQDKEEAAEQMGKAWMREDGSMPDELTIWVNPLDEGKLCQFVIVPVVEVNFYAREILPQEAAA